MLLFLALAPRVFAAPPAPAAERAFLWVMDGARGTEMAIAPDGEFPYCPLLSARYAEGGVLVPILDNRHSTYTETAHRTILTSRLHYAHGLPWNEENSLQRTMFPTLFEAFEHHYGLDESAGYIVSNSVFLDNQDRSLYPQLQGYGAEIDADTKIQDLDDQQAAEYLVQHMITTRETRIVLDNLHQADTVGHREQFDGYVSNLNKQDTTLNNLSDELGDPRRDIFFTFADHGRHDDDTWANHGDNCAGCRQSFLVAWGAGIRDDGAVLGSGWEEEDLAVTMAWLLGVDLPAARGRLIVDLLDSPPPDPAPEDSLVDPWILATSDGAVHMVAERMPWAGDGGELWYRRSRDGTTWPTAWTAIPLYGETEEPEDPRLWQADRQIFMTWRAYDPTTRYWGIYLSSSADGGDTWSPAEVADAAVLHGTFPNFAVDPSDGNFEGAWWSIETFHGDDKANISWFSRSYSRSIREDSEKIADLHIPYQCQILFPHEVPYTICVGIMDKDYTTAPWNRELVGITNFTQQGKPILTQLTDTDAVSFWPSAITDPEGNIHLAWAERTQTQDTGAWTIWYMSSADSGETWSTPLQISDPNTAEQWRPSITWTSEGALIAYTGVTGDEHQAKLALVKDGAQVWRTSVATRDAMIEQVVARESGNSPGTVVVTWGVAEGTLSHHVETATVSLDTQGETGDTDADTDSDTDTDADTDTDTDTSVDNGGDNGGLDDSGEPPVARRCGCASTPEAPAAAVLAGLALAGLAARRRRR